MDLSPGYLFSSLVLGAIGLLFFRHGKREGNFVTIGVGTALLVFPYFVHSLLTMWLVGGGIVGGWWWFGREG